MLNRTALLSFASLALVTPTEATAGGASCIPAFNYAMFGKEDITLSGGAVTNSYNSATGTFTLSNSNGDVGTNGSACPTIKLSGGVDVNGDADYGATGSSCTISSSGGSTITGTSGPLPQNVSLPSVTIPTVGTNQGDISCSGNCAQPKVLATNQTFGSISVSGGKSITLNAGTYRVGGIKLTGGSSLIIGSGPVLVYIDCSDGELDLSGGNVTNSSKISTNLVFMLGPACGGSKVSGGANASYAVYAPDTDIALSGGTDIYGAVVGKSIKGSGGTAVHYDRALASFEAGPFKCVAGEVSRASPIVATIGGTPYVVQGTYEYPFPTKVPLTTSNVATWTFQYIKGHVRARAASSISTNASGYTASTNLFDAATRIPSAVDSGCSAKNGSCRRIFTTTTTTPSSGLTTRPTLVTLSDATAPTIAPLITAPLGGSWTAANNLAIIRAILRAPLGGVDRSTVAVITPSTLAPAGTTRPTMAYFGGTDGMLHAVCVTTGGSTATQSNICPHAGTELWAFMPRVQLPLVGNLNTRLDGSVHVVDAFGDFTNTAMSGQRSFRTILTFQTGFSSAVADPAAYAFDITDPASPVLLWEYTTPTTVATLDFGAGLVATPGRAVIGSALSPTNFVAFETNNGGSGTSGVVATALQLETGTKLWQFGSLYPTAAAVPATGMPGGAVAVDRADKGFVTDLVMGDLYGRLWRLDVKTGTNVFGTNPLFQFSSVRHPIGTVPAVYSNGNTLYAAFASGGYVDPTGTSWNTAAQYAIAVKLQPSATPVDETTTACQGTCNLQVKQSIASSYAFAQATIVGSTLNLVTDSSDVNSTTFGSTQTATGRLTSINLGTGTAATTTIYSGVGALAALHQTTTAVLYGAGNDKQQQVGTAATSPGDAVDHTSAKLSRRLWIRTQ
jgi:hypothetical protein